MSKKTQSLSVLGQDFIPVREKKPLKKHLDSETPPLNPTDEIMSDYKW